MKLHKIEAGQFKLDGGAMFGVVPKILWKQLYPSDENNLCTWALRCLLVEDNDKLILIDTGMGDKQDSKFFKHYFPTGDIKIEDALKRKGFSPEDITDVIITHLHFDHVGGAVVRDENQKLVPSFPNAVYHVSKKQWNWAKNTNRREKASFLPENFVPLEKHGVLNLVEEESELFPDISVKMFTGHTDGQMLPLINYKGRTLVYAADLFPATAHLPMPYIMGYDTRPLDTLNDKDRFFAEAIENDYVLFFEHDLYNECCSLHETPKGVREKKTFTLEEFSINPTI